MVLNVGFGVPASPNDILNGDRQWLSLAIHKASPHLAERSRSSSAIIIIQSGDRG
jgi:hypothetical protein